MILSFSFVDDKQKPAASRRLDVKVPAHACGHGDSTYLQRWLTIFSMMLKGKTAKNAQVNVYSPCILLIPSFCISTTRIKWL